MEFYFTQDYLAHQSNDVNVFDSPSTSTVSLTPPLTPDESYHPDIYGYPPTSYSPVYAPQSGYIPMEQTDEFRDHARTLRSVPKVASPLTVKLSDVMGEGMAGRHGIPPDSESSQPGVQERSLTTPTQGTDNGTPHVDGGGGTGSALCYIYGCKKSVPKDSVSGRKHLRDAHGKLLEKERVECDATGCGTTLSVAAFPVHYLGHLKLYTYKCPSVYCTHNSRPDTFGRHLDSTRCHLCPRCLVDFESLKARNIHRATCAYPVLVFPRDWAQREFSDWTSQEAQAAELATRVWRAKLRQR